MNKKIAVPASIVLTAFSVYMFIGYRRLQNEVIVRFPDLNPKRCRQAYNHLMRLSLTGRIDVDGLDDEGMDTLFLEIYHNL